MRPNLAALLVVLLACSVGTALAFTQFSDVPQGTPPQGGDDQPFDLPVPTLNTYYNDEVAFQADAGALVQEDFSASSAEPGGVCAGDSGTLNSGTNDGCFSTGGVVDGFTLFAFPGTYVSLGTGFLGAPIPLVGPNTFADDMDLTFDPSVTAVGFVVVGDLITTVDVNITIYGDSDVLLDSVTVHGTLAGTFIGMISDAPIARLEFREPGGGGELMGNLQFGTGGGGDGGGDDGGDVPATTGIGIALLVLLLGGGSAYFLRRK